MFSIGTICILPSMYLIYLWWSKRIKRPIKWWQLYLLNQSKWRLLRMVYFGKKILDFRKTEETTHRPLVEFQLFNCLHENFLFCAKSECKLNKMNLEQIQAEWLWVKISFFCNVNIGIKIFEWTHSCSDVKDQVGSMHITWPRVFLPKVALC